MFAPLIANVPKAVAAKVKPAVLVPLIIPLNVCVLVLPSVIIRVVAPKATFAVKVKFPVAAAKFTTSPS